MSIKTFLKAFIKNHKEIGSVIPSSKFLGKKMISCDFNNAKTIIELGAGTGVFTKNIFELRKENQKVIILEKDKNLYKILLKKFPNNTHEIFNIDILDIEDLLIEKEIKIIDLIISGLPFKSLPKNISFFVFNDLLNNYSNEQTKFIQFSYFKNSKIFFDKKFSSIKIKKCYLNFPMAYIFYMTKHKKTNSTLIK